MFNPNVRWRYSRRPHRIINFCIHYHLEDNLEEESFNKKWSHKDLQKYLRKNYRRTWKFINAIIKRIREESNIIIVIYGSPNSGKSEGAQMIAFLIRYFFWKYMNKKIELFTAFSTSEFQIILTDMEIGDVGIRDESPDESGAESKNVSKYLNNITRIIRQNQNSFIFLDPILIKLKVASYYLETAGKNKKKRKIRFILYDKDHKPMGHIYLPLHWCGLFRKKYKEKKTTNINLGMAMAGMFTPNESKRSDRDENRLLEFCKKNGATKKGEIVGLLSRYNRQFKNPEDMIKGSNNYIGIVISNVWHDLNKFKMERIEKRLEKQMKIQKNIKYVKGDNFSLFVKNNLVNDKYKRIGFGLCRGDSEDTIMGNNPDITENKMKYIIQRLKNLGDINTRLGFLFERWWALKLGVPKEKLRDVLGGTSNAPDLIWKGIIYSIKWRSNRKAKSIPFYQSKKGDGMLPEYTFAKEHNKKYILVFMNPAWDMRVRLIRVNPKGKDKIVVYKKP